MFITHALANSLNYSGRSTRSQFWLWTLTVAVLAISWFYLVLIPLQQSDAASNFELMRFLVGFPFVLLVPSVPLMIRRVRDAGHGPKILLWLLAPLPIAVAISGVDPMAGLFIAFGVFCFLEAVVGVYLLYVFCKPSKTY